jgi:2,5-diketo-D-gluconate reductase A
VDLYLIHWPYARHGLFVETWKTFEALHAEGLIRAIGVSNFLEKHLEQLAAETDVVPAVNQIEVHPTFQQHDLSTSSVERGIEVEAYSPLGQGADLESEIVTRLAKEHDATPAQIVLAWHLAQGRIVIPKSVTPERIVANFQSIEVELSIDELAEIDTLESGTRLGADPDTADFTQFRS